MEILAKGSRGASVKVLQSVLHMSVDGIFGEVTHEAVKSFQREHGLEVDGIVGDNTWRAIDEYLCESARQRGISEIIVHCTDTPCGRDCTVEDIRRWHLQRGWSDIGYHYVVYLDGSVHAGRHVNIVGAHCKNHNAHSIGVCYVGGKLRNGQKNEDTRTESQRRALVGLITKLKRCYPDAVVYGHRDFNTGKACPCFDARKEYAEL